MTFPKNIPATAFYRNLTFFGEEEGVIPMQELILKIATLLMLKI